MAAHLSVAGATAWSKQNARRGGGGGGPFGMTVKLESLRFDII